MKDFIYYIMYIPKQIFYMIAGKFEKEQSIDIDYGFETYQRMYSEAHKQMLIDLAKDKEKRY